VDAASSRALREVSRCLVENRMMLLPECVDVGHERRNDVQSDNSECFRWCRRSPTGLVEGGHYIFVCSLVDELTFSRPLHCACSQSGAATR